MKELKELFRDSDDDIIIDTGHMSVMNNILSAKALEKTNNFLYENVGSQFDTKVQQAMLNGIKKVNDIFLGEKYSVPRYTEIEGVGSTNVKRKIGCDFAMRVETGYRCGMLLDNFIKLEKAMLNPRPLMDIHNKFINENIPFFVLMVLPSSEETLDAFIGNSVITYPIFKSFMKQDDLGMRIRKIRIDSEQYLEPRKSWFTDEDFHKNNLIERQRSVIEGMKRKLCHTKEMGVVNT